jgi:hypothetical protein
MFYPCIVSFVKNTGDSLLEQRINNNILVKLEKDTIHIYKMLQQVYGEETMKRTVFHSFKMEWKTLHKMKDPAV